MEITQANSNLAVNNFANEMSRYKIDGNAVWEFYDDVNFNGELLFIARGPIGWTGVDEAHNDKVESVRPSLGTCILKSSRSIHMFCCWCEKASKEVFLLLVKRLLSVR